MSVNITYMGTKRALTAAVSEVIAAAQPGVLLDAFSGMCAVGAAVGPARQVWTNDVQVFASEVARALFRSRQSPRSPLSYADDHFTTFRKQKERLSFHFARSLSTEEELLSTPAFDTFQKVLARLHDIRDVEVSHCQLRSPHLFSTLYSANFFGMNQAIEADSIYESLRANLDNGIVNRDDHRWGLIALGRALLKVANSTGHFAQFLKPNSKTFRRYIALRKRSVWVEWLESLALMSPIGDRDWRERNKVFREDSLKLIPKLARSKAPVSVIYADPPYTDDQYSRFYHLLETLILYDYPEVSGAGLYRSTRFQTPFSLKSKSIGALNSLVRSCAETGADLVLSYPSNGLAIEAGTDIRRLLKAHFKRVETSHSQLHEHSTFGASKGHAKASVNELIYLARSA